MECWLLLVMRVLSDFLLGVTPAFYSPPPRQHPPTHPHNLLGVHKSKASAHTLTQNQRKRRRLSLVIILGETWSYSCWYDFNNIPVGMGDVGAVVGDGTTSPIPF